MTVVSDKVKFFDAIKVDEGILRFGGNVLLKCIIGFFIVIVCGVWAQVPGLIVSFVGVCGYLSIEVYNTKKSNRNKSVNTALGILGETVADLVFVPIVGMAICDKPIQDKEVTYIKNEMREWGYATEFIEKFLQEKSKMHIDSIRLAATDLPQILRIRSQRKKGEGKISLKDIDSTGLCRRSYEICGALYNDLNNGLRDTVSDHYLSELKVRLKI
jgi:hypothetical protein